MIVAKRSADIKSWRQSLGATNVGFVPTMGALHEGHASLVDKSKAECGKTCVSIFINPTQFNDPNDYANYPTDVETDLDLLESKGVDLVFLPEREEIYQDQYRFKVSESELTKKLCGRFRPGHFDGVLTVVMKLLNIVTPDKCFMGEKDFQQLLLVQEMAKTFFINTEIVACPTLREADGLAMSSRNRRLSPDHRELAPLLFAKLKTAQSLQQAQEELTIAGFEVEYLEEHFNRRFVAAKLGHVRLIDNVSL